MSKTLVECTSGLVQGRFGEGETLFPVDLILKEIVEGLFPLSFKKNDSPSEAHAYNILEIHLRNCKNGEC